MLLNKIFKYSLIFFPIMLFAEGNYVISPPITDVSIDRPQNISFLVVNKGEEQLKMSISLMYFPVDSKFMPKAKAIDPETTKNDDLSQYIDFNPKVLSIKPGQQKTVRVSVHPSQGLADGEYRAHLNFKVLDMEKTNNTKNVTNTTKSNALMNITFKKEIAAVIYGSKGTGYAKLSTKCSTLKDGKVKVTVTNSGKWRFKGRYMIVNNEDLTDILVITRESIRDIVLNGIIKKTKEPIKIEWIPDDDKKETITTTCLIK
ncbi:MAG: hypothetical protein WCQ47_05010 [bacterium]